MESKITKKGYLYRQGKDNRWKRRFCEINGWFLSVYSNSSAKKEQLLAVVDLSGAGEVTMNEDIGSDSNNRRSSASFEDRRKSVLSSGGYILRIDLPKSGSTFALKAAQLEDAVFWLDLFCRTRDKARGVSSVASIGDTSTSYDNKENGRIMLNYATAQQERTNNIIAEQQLDTSHISCLTDTSAYLLDIALDKNTSLNLDEEENSLAAAAAKKNIFDSYDAMDYLNAYIPESNEEVAVMSSSKSSRDSTSHADMMSALHLMMDISGSFDHYDLASVSSGAQSVVTPSSVLSTTSTSMTSTSFAFPSPTARGDSENDQTHLDMLQAIGVLDSFTLEQMPASPTSSREVPATNMGQCSPSASSSLRTNTTISPANETQWLRGLLSMYSSPPLTASAPSSVYSSSMLMQKSSLDSSLAPSTTPRRASSTTSSSSSLSPRTFFGWGPRRKPGRKSVSFEDEPRTSSAVSEERRLQHRHRVYLFASALLLLGTVGSCSYYFQSTYTSTTVLNEKDLLGLEDMSSSCLLTQESRHEIALEQQRASSSSIRSKTMSTAKVSSMKKDVEAQFATLQQKLFVDDQISGTAGEKMAVKGKVGNRRRKQNSKTKSDNNHSSRKNNSEVSSRSSDDSQEKNHSSSALSTTPSASSSSQKPNAKGSIRLQVFQMRNHLRIWWQRAVSWCRYITVGSFRRLLPDASR